MRKSIILILGYLILLLVACSPTSGPEIQNNAPQQSSDGYPVPENSGSAYPMDPMQQELPAYPYPSSNNEPNIAYPIDTPDINPRVEGPKFEIDEPVIAGSNVVTGRGPTNVPIILIDVSEMGLQLGMTTIGPDGKFEFNLDQPLPASHSIGLQIGDLAGTEFNYDEFVYSKEYIDRPMIGIVFDIVSVVEN